MLPTKCDVTFYYVCPKCGDPYWLSANEVKTPGFKIVCFCGYVMKVQALENIKVSYKHRKVKPKVETKGGYSKTVIPEHVKEAYRTIRGLGYKGTDLKDKLMLDAIKFDTAAELVKNFMKDK